ncbi:MAG: helix-turn-helix domain-containing protein, partial [Aristaeellaceae bacterium]
MLKIGDFSKLSRVSIRMLRHYDEIGLLKPARIDPESGYRYYGAEQLPIAGRISALKDMGFTLAAIREILPCYGDRDALQHHLERRQAELQATIAQAAYRLRLLETAQNRLRKDDPTMNYDVTIKTFPPRYAATVRRVIPTYEEEGMLWNLLMEETAPLRLIDGDPCYCCAVFHDREFRDEQADVEVQKDVRGRCP